jgi:transposase
MPAKPDVSKNLDVRARLSPRYRQLLNDLMALGNDQSGALREAIVIAHMYHFGLDKMTAMRDADLLTDFGKNDPLYSDVDLTTD